MIHIQNLALPLEFDADLLRKKAADFLRVSPEALGNVRLARQSLDARKKSQIHFVCAVLVEVEAKLEDQILRYHSSPLLSRWEKKIYQFPVVQRKSPLRPVVVGMGPAGLFAALFLARNGLAPIVLERGKPLEERAVAVETFWSGGPLNETANVQFGEGGAGAFSDGKLQTGTHDPRISVVLDEFVRHGAPEEILWQQKPHVGTDFLRRVVKSMREELRALGCDIRFGHKLVGLTVRNAGLQEIQVSNGEISYSLDCDALLLAPGHSARDTFAMLHKTGVPMEPKPFAIGCRIEHEQAALSEAQYGVSWTKLPPADYKLACHLPSGRSAFTFCVCPGGQVVAAASTPDGVVTNGMSFHARNGSRMNGGFLVGVSPADFGTHVLDGVTFQETWEHAAYLAGGSCQQAPAQNVDDFLAGRPTRMLHGTLPTYRPGVAAGSLETCLPAFVTETLRAALPVFGRKLHGFDDASAVLTGVETRSSSPVRILRDAASRQSPLRGLYPCGEGAGYAGGITSAAVDGLRTAEAVAETP